MVTGAGDGIGRAIALALAAERATVVAVGRTRATLEAVAAEAEGSIDPHVCDVSSERDVAALAERLGRHGRLHVLVNNAGLRMHQVGDPAAFRKPLLELAVDAWDRIIATNLRGPFLTCRLLGPLLVAAKGASVINVSAGAGVRGDAGRSAYAASKFGLEGLTQSLAAEWRPLGIAVNALEPGAVVRTEGAALGLRPEAAERRLRPEALVPPALFLASQDATGVTGEHVNALAWLEANGHGGRERWAAG